jgi:hypothetical protein
MTNKAISCPVSGEKINESVARVASFLVTIIVTIVVLFKAPYMLILLGTDFALRAFTNGTYSPIKYLAKQLYRYSGLSEKKGDAAPKKFAAAIGFIFSFSIAALQLAQYFILADVVAGVLVFCAALEAFAGFCVGCVIYTYIQPFFNNSEDSISINL